MIRLSHDLAKHDINVIKSMFIEIFSDEEAYSRIVRSDLLDKIHLGNPLTKKEIFSLKERVFNDMLVDMDLAYINKMLPNYNMYLNDCGAFILSAKEDDPNYELTENEKKELNSISVEAQDVFECKKNFEVKYGAYIRAFLKPYYEESERIYEEKRKAEFEEDMQEEGISFPDYQHIEEEWRDPYSYE